MLRCRGRWLNRAVGALVFCFYLLAAPGALALNPTTYTILSTPFYDPNDLGAGCDGTAVSVSSTLPSAVPQPYQGVFSAAAASEKTNPNYLAGLFATEHHDVWPDPNASWGNSGVGPTWPDGVAGARGPFQFEYGTWNAYKVDGNNDGKIDPDNLVDAAFTAANYLHQSGITDTSQLGSLDQPFKPGTFTDFAAIYNAGPANIDMLTGGSQTAPLSVIKGFSNGQTYDYVTNAYTVVSSGFTKGNATWGDGKGNFANQAGAGDSSQATNMLSGTCSGGVVAGSVVQTAVGLSWPQPPEAAKPARDAGLATDAYQQAIRQYNPNAPFGGEDCGAFVATVMRASGADPNYPLSGTAAQQTYVESSSKYAVITDAQSTADLQPGDILIVNSGAGAGANGHTFIYLGRQSSGYDEASASYQSRMPNLGYTSGNFTSGLMDVLGRGHYIVARLR